MWATSTLQAIGLPMVSNFMTYFPVFLYPRTFRNCRDHMMRHLNATTFGEAFSKLNDMLSNVRDRSAKMFSPVNIILSYAYFFERQDYDWHIHLGTKTLSSYNAQMFPPPLSQHALNESDITRELHFTVHSKYYQSDVYPLEQAICYTQIVLGMTNIAHCDRFRNKTNLQLFQFHYIRGERHTYDPENTWCKPGPKRQLCKELIDERYKSWVNVYGKTYPRCNTSYLKII